MTWEQHYRELAGWRCDDYWRTDAAFIGSMQRLYPKSFRTMRLASIVDNALILLVYESLADVEASL